MWLNTDKMPLQTLIDKIARSRMWFRLGCKIDDISLGDDASLVYEVQLGTSHAVQTKKISFKEICEMFEWKSFKIDETGEMVLIEHTPEHLKDRM